MVLIILLEEDSQILIGTGAGSAGNTSCFILGRSNGVHGTAGGAIGGSNTVYSSTAGGNALAIGNLNHNRNAQPLSRATLGQGMQ